MINAILRLLKPIQVFLQRIGHIESKFTKADVDQLLKIIKAGDVLGSYESGRFTSWLIKGDYDHAAIVNENLYVVEAVGDKMVYGMNVGGVRKVPLEEWIWKKTHIFVARHKNPMMAQAAALNANKYIGKGYDYAFSSKNETMYCSELCYVCYKQEQFSFMSEIDEDQQVYAVDFLHTPHMEVIYDSRRNSR